MPGSSGFQGIYRTADRPKRQQEVLERLEAGKSVKHIAKDLGVAPSSVLEIIERLREAGALPAGPRGEPSS